MFVQQGSIGPQGRDKHTQRDIQESFCMITVIRKLIRTWNFGPFCHNYYFEQRWKSTQIWEQCGVRQPTWRLSLTKQALKHQNCAYWRLKIKT